MAASKIALVTGANRGIGLEIAKQLSAKGLRVIVACRDIAKAKETAKKVPNAIPLALDVSGTPTIESAAAQAATLVDHIDILINNAGINNEDWEAKVETLDEKRFAEVLQINTIGPHLVTKFFLPLLRKSSDARVINISSRLGQLNGMEEISSAYAASKAALNALTLQWASSLKEEGIAVNSVHPGWVKTDMGGENAPDSIEAGADTAVWLATAAPKTLTGKFLKDRTVIEW